MSLFIWWLSSFASWWLVNRFGLGWLEFLGGIHAFPYWIWPNFQFHISNWGFHMSIEHSLIGLQEFLTSLLFSALLFIPQIAVPRTKVESYRWLLVSKFSFCSFFPFLVDLGCVQRWELWSDVSNSKSSLPWMNYYLVPIYPQILSDYT